jgi:hypothetical protein
MLAEIGNHKLHRFRLSFVVDSPLSREITMKLLNEILTLPDRYSITQEASEYVKGLMLEAEGIELPPKDPQGQGNAVRMGREIRKHLSEVEMTRKILVGPLNDTVSKINEIARLHTEPMRKRLGELEQGVTDYQVGEQQRIEQEQRDRQAEIDRLAQERLKAEQAVEDAKPTGDDALDDINKANAEMALESAEQAERLAIVQPIPEPVKARGAATGQKMVIEVTDLKALYAARPDLCRVEANLAAIRATCFPTMEIPGLKLTWKTSTTIRK